MIKFIMKFITILITLLLTGATLFAQSPLNWTIDEINPNEDVTLYPDETFFSDGMKSCHLQLNSGAVPYLVGEVYYVTPGAAYEFSFDVFDNDTAGQVKVYADFYDTYGFNVFGQPPVFSPDSSEWQTIGWKSVIPDQAVVGYVLIKFYCQPDLYNFTRTAHVWIDNIQFRQNDGENLVANGSFEEWVVGLDEMVNNCNSLFIYPNPAKEVINLKLARATKCISISDLMGREVLKLSSSPNNYNQINISMLSEGMYLLSAVLENDRIIQSKLIVSR
jgi:hypothetical protein